MKTARWLSVATLLAASHISAQSSSDTTPQPGDPPTRVARLNFLDGEVSFQPSGLEDWTDATINYPLTTGDHLVTLKDARAELHIGSNAIRLDANSNFGFLNLDDSIVQVSLTEGSMEIHLRQLDDNDSFEIATPNGAITLLRTGDYRIDTDPDRDATMLTVRGGQAELFSGSSSMIIKAQETAYVHENQDPDVRVANQTDTFDTFASSRDSVSDTPAAASHVAPEVTGAEDLNNYGSWQNLPTVGDVWVPPVAADWAPYSDGDWSYVDPWGWTWVDSAPWGFAPFHYGRWIFARNRWMWVPDSKTTPVVYAPALVAFYGGGASGTVSWYALGPREQYIPPWRSVQIGALGLPIKYSTNRNAPGAIRTLSQIDFVGATRVHPGVALSIEGDPQGAAPSLAPVRDSVLAGTIRPHPAIANRPLVARTAPPPAAILFTFKQGLLAQNLGRPLAAKQMEDLRKQVPYATVQRPMIRASKPLIATPKPAAKPAPGRAGKPPIRATVAAPPGGQH
jgi:hypothetical protein